MRRCLLVMLALAAAVMGFGLTPDYPYVFKQFAGAFPLGDGGLTVDSSGSLLVVDSTFFLIYKISSSDLSLLAGSGTFSYADGPELGTYLYGQRHHRRQLRQPLRHRLARYLGTSAEFWLGLQLEYDLRTARRTRLRIIEKAVQPRPAAA